MTTEEKISCAKKRIQELELLINAWAFESSKLSPVGYLDFRITEDQFKTMKDTTQVELNNLIDNKA
jgi:hypothetical protein